MENFDVIRELVTAVKELSPLAWQAAKQQVQAQIISSAIWLVISTYAIVFLVRILNKSLKELKKGYDSEDYAVLGVVFSGLGILIAVIAGLMSLDTLFNTLVAPDYQTIKLLIDLAK